nr:hypothetical protein [Ruminococcus flavefaciens]
MMKYLQNDLLEETGLKHFDMWAANFAETVTESQLSPEGNSYQMKTRFARFNNMPELMALFKECADIKTTDQLGLKIPECEMHTVVAQPSEIQKKLIENLSERAKRIRLRQVKPTEDTMKQLCRLSCERLIRLTILLSWLLTASIRRSPKASAWQS